MLATLKRALNAGAMAGFLIAGAAATSAQTTPDPHHPGGTPPSAAAPGQSQPQMTGGMMDPGMMSRMTGGGMMDMMANCPMMGAGASHAEGRIAFLRAELVPAAGEVDHLEVKPIDPRSKTRISNATVVFDATNRDTAKSVKGELHPMWGGSGLHYASNSTLLGDGTYDFVITVQPPSFARSVKDKDLFTQPASARFHFKLKGGALVEVSEAIPSPN